MVLTGRMGNNSLTLPSNNANVINSMRHFRWLAAFRCVIIISFVMSNHVCHDPAIAIIYHKNTRARILITILRGGHRKTLMFLSVFTPDRGHRKNEQTFVVTRPFNEWPSINKFSSPVYIFDNVYKLPTHFQRLCVFHVLFVSTKIQTILLKPQTDQRKCQP